MDQQEGDRHSQQPAPQEQVSAAEPVSQPAGVVIGQGFANPKSDDKGKDGRIGGDAKLRFGELREDAALQAHHAPYKGIDDHQQGKLFPILFKS